MSQKVKITRYIAEQLGLSTTDANIKKLIQVWWQNPRIKDTGGYQLTDAGYRCIKQADLKDYKIKIPKQTHSGLINQQVVWLDQFIDCPWHLTKMEIRVFSEQMAVQLVLFSGNILKYTAAKAGKLEAA